MAVLFSDDLVVLHPQYFPRCENVDALLQEDVSFRRSRDSHNEFGLLTSLLNFFAAYLLSDSSKVVKIAGAASINLI